MKLTVGADAPEFSAENCYGEVLKLSAQREKGPVILVFLRGFS
jgi:peroxiredoxin